MSLNPFHSRTPRRPLQSLKLASLLGGIIGFGFGCVLTLEPIEPCASGSNNKLDDNGECECRIGYEWCDPDDATNLDCCDSDVGDTSGDGDGDSNTSVGDGDGDTATGDGDGDTGDGDGEPGDGDGDGDGDCTGVEFPPETCLPEEEGSVWCTNTDMAQPQCGQFFVCENGMWVEDTVAGDESCMFDNYDFSYGCYDNGMEVVFPCGDGSGAPCTDEPALCTDPDLITYCQFGKETTDSCLDFCQNEGIEGMTYEHGYCDDVTEPDNVACACCDLDQPGCGE
jgi:hypothetical protein